MATRAQKNGLGLAGRASWVCGGFVALLSTVTATAETFLFEAEIQHVETPLAGVVRAGWVISGSFSAALERGQTPTAGPEGLTQIAGVLGESEYTVDLHRIVRISGIGVGWEGQLSYRDGDLTHGEADFVGLDLAVAGPEVGAAEAAWRVRWLQIWAFDAGGTMLRGEPTALAPVLAGRDSAWLRLLAVNAAGETAAAEGPVRILDPWDGATHPEEAIAGWQSAVRELGGQLAARDQQIAELTTQVNAQQQRIASMRQLVDGLVTERQALQAEVERLSAHIAQVDPAALETVAALEADRAVLQGQLEAASAQTETLSTQLAAALGAQRAAEQALAAQSITLADVRKRLAAARADNPRSATHALEIAVVEAPVAVETPVADAVQLRAPLPLPTRIETRGVSERATAGTEIRRPRKFR